MVMRMGKELFERAIANKATELEAEFVGCQYYYHEDKSNLCLVVIEVRGGKQYNKFCMYLFWYAGGELHYLNLSRSPQGRMQYHRKYKRGTYTFKIIIDGDSITVEGKNHQRHWSFISELEFKHLPGFESRPQA